MNGLYLAFVLTVHADFEGGSFEKAESVSKQHLRVAVKGETDQAGRNRQASWYYFRIDDAPKSELIIDLVGLPGEYNYQPNRGAISDKTPPVISYDQQTWTHVTNVEYDSQEPRLRLRIAPRASRFWLAHTPPYTNQNLAALRKDITGHAAVKEEVIGKSVGGRELYLWSFDAGRQAKTVWLMFRQHSWESGSSWVSEGLIRRVVSDESLRAGITWKVFPFADPDGVARGGVRFNSNGYDLNRNWDVEDAHLMPEITAQRNAIAKWIRSGRKIELFLGLHNTETSEYLESAPGATALAERFFAALKETTTFDPSRPLFYSAPTTTEGMKGRMTVVQGLYRDFRVPGFLMEQRIAYNPKLGRFPTVQDRLKFGKQLAAALGQAVSPAR